MNQSDPIKDETEKEALRMIKENNDATLFYFAKNIFERHLLEKEQFRKKLDVAVKALEYYTKSATNHDGWCNNATPATEALKIIEGE